MNIFRTSLAALAASAVLAVAAQAETLRLSHNVGDTTTWQKGAEKFGELLSEKTDGAYDVRVFPNAQLSGGDQMKQAEMVGRGALDLVVTSAINVTPLVPEMAVFSLPYMYADYAQVDATTQGDAVKPLEDILASKGIKVLAWGENGFRELTNNSKPVKSPEDMKGMNIRVAGPMYIDVMNALGANPQQMQWSETLTALQQGVVDGQENPHAINRDQKFWEVQKYITNIHYMLWVGPMLVSDPWFRKLDPQTKALVEKAAKEAAAYEWKWSAEQDEIALKECLARGMVINDVSDEPAWTEAARSVWPQFYDKVGGKAVVDEALAIMQQ